MCLDNIINFQCNKKTAYKIFREHVYNLESFYSNEFYKIGEIYKPNLKITLETFWIPISRYPAGFHAFPYLKYALSYFLSTKNYVRASDFVIGKIEFNNIIARGLDNKNKCIVVDSMKILSYEPINKYLKNVV